MTAFKSVRYRVDADTGCHVWLLSLDSHGYGHETVDHRTVLAHIAAYERKYGPVPEGMELDHKCRRRACINPDHLEPVTHEVNSHRGDNTKLNQEVANEIIWLFQKGATKLGLSKQFGVSRRTIKRITDGQQQYTL